MDVSRRGTVTLVCAADVVPVILVIAGNVNHQSVRPVIRGPFYAAGANTDIAGENDNIRVRSWRIEVGKLRVQVKQDMMFHYSRVGLIMIQHITRLTSICKPHFGAQTR